MCGRLSAFETVLIETPARLSVRFDEPVEFRGGLESAPADGGRDAALVQVRDVGATLVQLLDLAGVDVEP